jgi:hypothetical protein
MKPTKEQLVELVRAERVAKAASERGSMLEKKYRVVQGELQRAQREISALLDVGDHKPRHIHINPRPHKHHSRATPFMVFSDWHVEEEVKPQTVGGKNRFTLKIAEERATRIVQTGHKLVEEVARDMKIEDVALFFLGDFITGNIHDENVENAQLGPIPAIHFAQDLLESALRFLLANTPYRYTVYCKVGNHSRITRFVHASTEADNSLETAMYVGMARNFRQEERVRFVIEPSYFSLVKIQGVRVRYHHGHAVAYGGGVGGLHIPLRKAIKSWNETERADFDIMGHYHSFLEHTTYKYMVNGSLIGYSAYAERVKAVMEPPVQGFGVFHSKHGVTRLSPLYGE